jgi:hypothetical protein
MGSAAPRDAYLNVGDDPDLRARNHIRAPF